MKRSWTGNMLGSLCYLLFFLNVHFQNSSCIFWFVVVIWAEIFVLKSKRFRKLSTFVVTYVCLQGADSQLSDNMRFCVPLSVHHTFFHFITSLFCSLELQESSEASRFYQDGGQRSGKIFHSSLIPVQLVSNCLLLAMTASSWTGLNCCTCSRWQEAEHQNSSGEEFHPEFFGCVSVTLQTFWRDSFCIFLSTIMIPELSSTWETSWGSVSSWGETSERKRLYPHCQAAVKQNSVIQCY